MKKRQRFMRLCFLIFLVSLCSHGLHAATVTWMDSVTSDATDTNVILDAVDGDIILPNGPRTVTAATVDVTITVATADVTVTANPLGGSCLNLIAAAGLSITIDLTAAPYDLTFQGATITTATSFTPLYIFIQGAVNIKMNGGRTLTLGSGTGIDGTQMYVIMQASDTGVLSINRFDTTTGEEAEDVNIVIQTASVLSYAALAGDSTSSGTINFCPTNSAVGRTVLTIDNQGSFLVDGNTLVLQTLACSTVDRTTPAGAHAICNIQTGTACQDSFYNPTSSTTFLTIANQNNTYPELLIDPFFTQGARAGAPFIGTFNGLRYGAVIGALGTLNIGPSAYLDYVGLTNDVCPPVTCIPTIDCSASDMFVSELNCPCGSSVQQFIKARNPSALIIDGWLNTLSVATINLGVQSGIYFRSGVDVNGVIENPTAPNIYTIAPTAQTPGSGEIVFDVEGPLDVVGSNVVAGTTVTLNSRMEILSYEVSQIDPAGPLFPDPGFVGPDLFPIRTFSTSGSGAYLQYNKASWLINNIMSVTDTSIGHTDELHVVCQSNDILSEATYIGGETWLLGQQITPPEDPAIPRPNIQFFNSILHLYTSAAFAGVDLEIPDLVVDNVEFTNFVQFIFYSNGRAIDNGTGRTLMLGTLIGSQACDGSTIISEDAHLDVIQLYNFTSVNPSVVPGKDQQLYFTVSTNTNLITSEIGSTDIIGQTSIHEIYLGANSNNSIGENAAPSCISQWTMSSTPSEWIAGNFFNFSTHGGSVGIPDTSNVTGQGGIFVDLNGTFGILPQYLASIAVMITKSCNGVVDLPKNQVVFANRIGIADWQLQLSNTNPETVIIPTGSVYSDYTLNWVSINKSTATGFVPYDIGDVNVCSCPVVTTANITGLPTIQGSVDQLQIVDSRIGDPAQIIIDGGYVREVLWLSNCRPAEAPVAVIVLQNEGQLGMNTAHRNVDSINTETTFGVNGVTIVANGNARVDLNTDMIVNNICAILQGPNWTASNVLEFRADAPRFIVVTEDGILDLSSFTVGGTIRMSENVRLLFEAGSRLVLGAAVLEFNENAILEFERSPQAIQYFATADTLIGPINNALNPLITYNITQPHPLYAPFVSYGDAPTFDLHNTDAFRVRIMGQGTISMRDKSQAFLGVNAMVGIETLSEVLPGGVVCTIPTTNVTLELSDTASWQIGFGNNDEGGTLQIGNVQNLDGHSVNFTLTLNGADATFELGAGAFVGLGAGVARPTGLGEAQSECLADTLFNVSTITFNFNEGSFQAERIFDSNDPRSHSLVIGNVGSFALNYAEQGDDPVVLDTDNFGVYGGGNLLQIVPATGTNAGEVYMIDVAEDTTINIPVTGGPSVPDVRLSPSILASTDMLDNLTVSGLTPTEFFQTMKVLSGSGPVSRSYQYSTIAPQNPLAFRESRTGGILGYVDRTGIGRMDVYDIIDAIGASQADNRTRAYDIGTVIVTIDTAGAAPGPVLTATLINE